MADLHLRKSPLRNEEYQQVFDNLIISLKEQKPDRIVIVGDLVHDYLDLQGEQLMMAYNLLKSLTEIASVRITRGNHDCKKGSLKRVDSIKAIIETLQDHNIIYYDKTGFYDDENVTWVVWHHGDKIDPWKTKEGKQALIDKKTNNRVYIDLFHNPINGCKLSTGFEMNSKSYYSINDFFGSFSMCGDIHILQYLNKEKTKAYSSSLIEQDFSEGDDQFHGYLLWNLINKKAEEISIKNDYSFKNIKITPYVDFDDLDFEIENPTKFMRIRFIWGTLPQTRNKDNERKVINYIKSKYENVIISHKNEFLESEKMDTNDNITLANINDKSVQHEVFRNFLSKIGVEEKVIDDVISLDEEILSEINLTDDINVEWDIIKFGGKNFMSYEQIDIDWRDLDGLFQIQGKNVAGKTTIMKILTYSLFGKTLETETKMKYGDSRFINNRNGANFCESYMVIKANGEYFGIKKRTDITKSKDGNINGAPTTLNYYILSNPDEPMTEETSLNNLDESRKASTQKKLEQIICTYDNFMRIVMTTSDTLNRILSNDMAVFIDSILFDSGLDVFDKKLEGLKSYQKRLNEKVKITCNVELKEGENTLLLQEITQLENEIKEIKENVLPDIQNRILTGRSYVETLTKKLYKIDPEIYSLDINDVKKEIGIHENNIKDFNLRSEILNKNISTLKESYDDKRLQELVDKKEAHKNGEYQERLKIKTIEQTITDYTHKIEIINGEIFRLKQDGTKLKKEILELKESKTCPTCGQPLLAEHQHNIDDKVKIKEKDMFEIVEKIKSKENKDIVEIKKLIEDEKLKIEKIQEKIAADSLNMEKILIEVGALNNDKNEVDKRKDFQNEINLIGVKIQNENLKLKNLNQKIENYENSLKQIEENQKIDKTIEASKTKITLLESTETNEKQKIFIKNNEISNKNTKINDNLKLIKDFKEQEYHDMIMNLYKKCVHRDGIPKQMLINYIIPKINLTLEKILSIAPFKVWLDLNDLRLKLAYNDRPNAIIDCIGASGKERTFSSVVLKFALNQINVKAKPTMFLLDEIMGKLDEESIEEFVEILKLIKNGMKKVIIIEHRVNLEPDYNINVELDEDGISSLTIN